MPLADTTNRRPILLGLAASAALTVLVVAGSRNLEHYDPALFGYTVASVVAFGALVYRYAVWLRRPATRVYWRRGWQLMRERKRLAKNAKSAVATVAHNIVEQARLVMLVMVNVTQLWILAATVEAALARSYRELLPLVIASGFCWLVSLSLILWWRPASRRHTSTGYIRETKL